MLQVQGELLKQQELEQVLQEEVLQQLVQVEVIQEEVLHEVVLQGRKRMATETRENATGTK